VLPAATGELAGLVHRERRGPVRFDDTLLRRPTCVSIDYISMERHAHRYERERIASEYGDQGVTVEEADMYTPSLKSGLNIKDVRRANGKGPLTMRNGCIQPRTCKKTSVREGLRPALPTNPILRQ
jgi:hypothetical protein